MVIIFTILFNILNAVADGLYDDGKKLLSGIVRLLYLAPTILLALMSLTGITIFDPIAKDYISIAISFVLVRYFLFDAFYNLTRGLNIFFVGSTKLYDKILQKLGIVVVVTTKMIAGFLGIIYLI